MLTVTLVLLILKIETGHVLLKLGDSHRDTEVRINEQGNSAEWEEKG